MVYAAVVTIGVLVNVPLAGVTPAGFGIGVGMVVEGIVIEGLGVTIVPVSS